MDGNAVAALVGLVATLLGLAIGRFWETKSESARWRRDQRVQAYRSTADGFYALRDALRDLAQAPPAGEDKARNFAKVTEVGISWNSSLVAVWLFGSERAAALARDVDLQIDELAEIARNRSFEFWDWHRERQPAQVAFERFLDEVRNDLDLPPFPSIVRKDPVSTPRAIEESRQATTADASNTSQTHT